MVNWLDEEMVIDNYVQLLELHFEVMIFSKIVILVSHCAFTGQ